MKQYARAFAYALITAVSLQQMLNMTTADPLILLFMLAGWLLFRQTIPLMAKVHSGVCHTLGALFAAMLLLGRLNDYVRGTTLFAPQVLGKLFICAAGLFLLLSHIIAWLHSRLQPLSIRSIQPSARSPLKVFFLSVPMLLAAWLPVFLVNYPGVLSLDSYRQFSQAMGETALHSAHPIAHTLLIRLFCRIGLWLFSGDLTAAVAVYSVCQAVLLAASFSYLLATMERFHIRRAAMWLVLAYYALVPYNSVYSVTMWKDVLFGASVLAQAVTLWRIVHYLSSDTSRAPVFETVMLFVTGVGMSILRNQAVIAYGVMAVMLVCFLWKRSRMLALAAVCVIPAVMLITGPLYNAIGVSPADNVIEAYSIPAQQLARVIHDGGDLTEEEIAVLSNVVDVDQVAENYQPYISDPIKALVQQKDPSQTYLKEHGGEMIRLWMRVGMRNPQLYIQAWIDQTKGYWYPDVQYWVYHPLTSYDLGGVKNAVQARSLLPQGITLFMDQLREIYHSIPFLGLLWSIGLAVWTALFLFSLCMRRGRRRLMIPFLPALAIMAALQFVTPVYAEFRYAYPLFATLPLMCVLPFDQSAGS